MPNAQVTVELLGKGDGLSAIISKAQREMRAFQDTVKAGFGIGIGASLGNALVNLPSLFKQNIEEARTFASQIKNTSQAAGIGAEPFQVLARSAKLSGAEMGDVTKAIVELGSKARDAIIGNGGAAGAFQQLGLNAEEFIKLAPERQLETLASAFVKAKDPAEAFSALVEILGHKEAPKLRAMLEELGTQGLNKLAADMAATGLIMRDDTIVALDEAGNQAEDSATRFRNSWGELAVSMKPIFDGLRRMGTLLAEALSWIVLRLEKIGIAAATLATIVSDILSGEFKGLQAYNDAAEQLAKDAEERGKKKRGAALAETKPTPSESLNPLVTTAQAKEKMSDVAENVHRTQQMASVDLARIGRDFTATNEQKRAATTAVLRAEADQITKAQKDLDDVIERLAKIDPRFKKMSEDNPGLGIAGIAKQLSKGPAGNKELATAIDAREKLTDTQSGVTQGILDANKDPKSISEGFEEGFKNIEDRWGSLAKQISSSVQTIGDAITGSLAGGMNQLLGTTQYWSQQLGSIAGPIMGSITQAISKMFAEWIVGRAAAAAKNIALSLSENAAAAPGALFESIKSFGVAALVGAAAFVAAKGLTGGFFEGGFTGLGDPSGIAGVVHNQEFVVPHDVTRAIGPGALANLVESVRNPSRSFEMPAALAPQAVNATMNSSRENSSGDEPWVQQPQVVLVDHRDQELVDRVLSNPRFKSKVLRIGRGNTGDFGSPT